MFNLYDHIASFPNRYRQLNCGESLISIYNCPLENEFTDMWTHHNYIVYVIEGRKIWHTAHSSYDLRNGSCVFVRKGACIVEQFFDVEFCLVMFFIPDDFICEVLKSKSTPISKSGTNYGPLITIEMNAAVHAFFQSMMLYFDSSRTPDKSLLELKFRELILTLADNPVNGELLSYFCSLLKEPQSVTLQRVMEDNFCFNLKLEQYAKLSSRSLSAFKRDFLKQYNTSPGKWLLEKKLNLALHLLTNIGKTVTEAAYESGFESPSHFSRAFRLHFGTSPSSIKQQATV